MSLVNNIKTGNLVHNMTTCKTCNKIVQMEHTCYTCIRAEEFDTYIFQCPYCKKVLLFEFDHKNDNVL